ncbi:hypothetical protein FQZ97_992790 [compost metagenome]
MPLTLAAESLRGSGWPISLKSLGSLSLTCCGTGCSAAALASSPKLACLPEAACLSTPSATAISCADTRQRWAAAATSMARAVAPALRNCSQELAMALLPPVPCTGPQRRLL